MVYKENEGNLDLVKVELLYFSRFGMLLCVLLWYILRSMYFRSKNLPQKFKIMDKVGDILGFNNSIFLLFYCSSWDQGRFKQLYCAKNSVGLIYKVGVFEESYLALLETKAHNQQVPEYLV